MRTRNLSSAYHYVVLDVSPPTEQLTLRHAIQKALQRLFGITRAGVPIDVLSGVGEEKGRVILRVAAEDAKFVLAALPTWTNPTMRVLKEGPFLPGIDVVDE